MKIQEPISLLLPRRCLICESTILSNQATCSKCALPPIHDPTGRCSRCFQLAPLQSGHCSACLTTPSPIRAIRYLWNYELTVADWITTMKYRPSPRLAHLLARYMATHIALFPLTIADWDCVVPIPASRAQRRKRGFNQCEILAEAIRTVSLPQLLIHTKKMTPQATVQHMQRAANVKNAFRAGADAAGKSILLVDDVITTGATIESAAHALIKAGARSIDVIALARAC